MIDCGCEKARRELEEYLRNEVCATERDVIEQHLAGCEDCSGEAHINQLITEVVRRSCSEDIAPEQLRQRVLNSLHTGS